MYTKTGLTCQQATQNGNNECGEKECQLVASLYPSITSFSWVYSHQQCSIFWSSSREHFKQTRGRKKNMHCGHIHNIEREYVTACPHVYNSDWSEAGTFTCGHWNATKFRCHVWILLLRCWLRHHTHCVVFQLASRSCYALPRTPLQRSRWKTYLQALIWATLEHCCHTKATFSPWIFIVAMQKFWACTLGVTCPISEIVFSRCHFNSPYIRSY